MRGLSVVSFLVATAYLGMGAVLRWDFFYHPLTYAGGPSWMPTAFLLVGCACAAIGLVTWAITRDQELNLLNAGLAITTGACLIAWVIAVAYPAMMALMLALSIAVMLLFFVGNMHTEKQ